jgi:hypothetical protein
MSRAQGCGFALLTCIAVLNCGHASADPRGIAAPPEPDTPESIEARRILKAADMAAWLPRLVGRYRYEGVADFTPPDQNDPHDVENSSSPSGPPPLKPPKLKTITGLEDCIAIGTGPGLHCVLDIHWDEENWDNAGVDVEGGVPFLSPALVLYGIDPSASVIRYLQLDTDGLAETESASLRGDTLTWTYATTCTSRQAGGVPPQCRRVTRVRAPHDGRVVQISIYMERWNRDKSKWEKAASFVFDGHRVSQDEHAPHSRAAPAGP